MGVKLVSASGGSVEIVAPATASNFTATMPANNGTVITTASTFAGTGPAFSAYMSVSQTVSNTTWTKVKLNVESFDTANCFDSTTNYRFTPNVAGYYQVNAYLRYTASSNLNRWIVGIWKNGSEYARPSELSLTSNYVSQGQSGGSTIVYMNGSTDYIEMYGYLNGSGTLQFIDDGNPAYTSTMSASLVRAA